VGRPHARNVWRRSTRAQHEWHCCGPHFTFHHDSHDRTSYSIFYDCRQALKYIDLNARARARLLHVSLPSHTCALVAQACQCRPARRRSQPQVSFRASSASITPHNSPASHPFTHRPAALALSAQSLNRHRCRRARPTGWRPRAGLRNHGKERREPVHAARRCTPWPRMRRLWSVRESRGTSTRFSVRISLHELYKSCHLTSAHQILPYSCHRTT
jgi:hypothetical protein